jgi:hypothetical protein
VEHRIGETLRKARVRREVQLAEVEEATRIRLKYLRAIEAEDWGALPEDVYARAFIRTYASFLGLDGERLAEEHRRGLIGEGSQAGPESGPGSGARRRPRRLAPRLPVATWITVAGVLLVAALAIAALPLDRGGENNVPSAPASRPPASTRVERPPPRPEPRPPGVSVRLTASAEIWVCLLDAGGRHLVDGRILEAGAEEGPFRSGSFTVSFGNGEVSMLIDGKQAEIPATSSPIGYSIDASGELKPLSETERPTCT